MIKLIIHLSKWKKNTNLKNIFNLQTRIKNNDSEETNQIDINAIFQYNCLYCYHLYKIYTFVSSNISSNGNSSKILRKIFNEDTRVV